MNEHEQNRRVAESICERFSWNGQEFPEGSYVALLDGAVLTVAKTPEEAIAILRAKDPNPKRGMVVEVAHPVVDIIR